MKHSRALTLVVILLTVVAGILCFPALHSTPFAIKVLAVIKFGGLVAAAACAWLVQARLEKRSGQRRAWSTLAIGLSFYSGGQSVLAFHQLFLATPLVFPSLGDPLFVVASVLDISALFAFCVSAAGSGLPLGRPLVFWSPALGAGAAFVAGIFPLLAPTVSAGGSFAEVSLNIFYPVSSFIALAPCLVMLRVAWAFRGGRITGVWVPLTLGFAAVLVSDVLFSYLTSLGLTSLDGIMDFLYASGYVAIFRGVSFQLSLVGE